MVVRQLSLFNETRAGGNPAVTPATTAVQQDGAYQITKLLWNRNTKEDIPTKTGGNQTQGERTGLQLGGRLREFYLLLGQAETREEVIALRKEYIDGFSEKTQHKVDNLCQDRINQINISQGFPVDRSVLDDPIAEDKRENNELEDIFNEEVKKVEVMIHDGIIGKHIDTLYNQTVWDELSNENRDLLGDCLGVIANSSPMGDRSHKALTQREQNNDSINSLYDYIDKAVESEKSSTPQPLPSIQVPYDQGKEEIRVPKRWIPIESDGTFYKDRPIPINKFQTYMNKNMSSLKDGKLIYPRKKIILVGNNPYTRKKYEISIEYPNVTITNISKRNTSLAA